MKNNVYFTYSTTQIFIDFHQNEMQATEQSNYPTDRTIFIHVQPRIIVMKYRFL